MNTKRRKRPLNGLFIIVGIMCLITLVSSSAALAQGNGPTIRKVRVLKVDRAGVQNPAGLAFSPEANAFYVVEGRGLGQAPPAATNIIKMTLSADRAGSAQIAAALKDPINVAYDSRFKRLLIFETSANRLLEVLTDRNGELDPSKMIGHDMRYLNLQNPQGLTVDPISGDIFILDSAGPQLIQIEPEADGGIDHTEVVSENLSETDLVNPRGLAFDPTTGHLHVVNPAEQELYELTQTGQVVTTRNLVALDLGNPQGMVFAPSGDSTDDPATMSLYLADSGLDSGTQGQRVGSGEIVELSLSGVVSETSQPSLNAATATSILNVRVAASSDDAEERPSGTVSLTSTDLELVLDGSNIQIVGMRFNGLPIPQGSAITKAYVQFQVDEATSDTTDLNIVGEASDNAATFVSSSGNISSRPTTNAAVAWSPFPWTTIGEAGPDQQTPDIAPVIQEIVNRPGWASGNSVVVIIAGSGKRVAEAYDGTQAGAPLLHIEYSSTGNHNPGVLINTPANGSTFNTGNTVSFSGMASDFEDGDLTANLVWTSDLDGQIGSGASFAKSDLSVGVHTITATATDSEGLTGVNTVTVTVFADAPILVGAGDIANDTPRDEATAKLLETIPGTVVTLGDNAYPNGTVDDYSNYYDPTWGRHKARTKPATGNHEYDTGTAAAYFNYFGAVAGDPSQGYYSFDQAGWHIIVLNSECAEVGGCGTTSPQGQWLQADLAANPRACTLAIWHKPLFSSGFVSSAGKDFWTLLYQAEADVILTGHDHNYERFDPQDPNGVADPNGIREFVVGTGGAGHSSFSTIAANSVVRDDTAWGVLKLTLHPTSYDWEFIPIAGQTFTDTGSAACVTSSSSNNPPTAVGDAYSTNEDTVLTVSAPGVLANDSDVDGDPLTAVLDGGPANGNLTLNADGSFTYTPNADFNGNDSFTYTANDGQADSNVATVMITVNAINDAPVAVGDAYATDEDTPLNVAAPGLLANDTDADGDPLTAVLVSDVSNGTLTLNADGSFNYIPNANYNGSDSFTYTANDGTVDSNVATVTIMVNQVNNLPTAVDDAYTTDEDTPLSVAAPGVLANDSDVDSDPLSAVLDLGPANGTLTLNSDGSVSYTPNANFNGQDSFSYHANDGTADSNVATVSITVNPVNDPPVADAGGPYVGTVDAAVQFDGSASSDVDGTVVSYDWDFGDGTTGTGATPTHIYAAAGTYMVVLTVTDDSAATDSDTTSADIQSMPNQAPVASDDAYATDEDTVLTVAAPGVLGNDSDADGNPLTAALNTSPSNGTLTLNSDGSFSYSPNADFNGQDSFSYHANDGTADSNVATVSITVNGVNDVPVAVGDVYSTNEDTVLTVAAPGVLGNDTDADGDPLTTVLNTSPSNGTLTLNSNGSFSYTPNANFNGSDSFTYIANDGTAGSNVATVSITVNGVNDIPVAVDDAYTTDEDTTLNVAAPGVLGNDTDADGDPLTAVLVIDVSNGALTLNADGSFSYTPNLNFNGTDSFTYVANDGAGDSSLATVTITVSPVNDPPVANANGPYAGAVDVAVQFDGTASSDVDGTVVSYDWDFGDGTTGTSATPTHTYAAVGIYTVVLTVTDDGGATDDDTTSADIRPTPNQSPVASDDAYTTDEDTPLNVSVPGVLANDTDADGDPLSAVLDSGPSNGSLTLNSDGSFGYTPNANFNGSDSFTYTANDGQAGSNVATVTITVNAINDAPVAVDDAYSTDEDTPLNAAAPGVLANDTDADGDPLSAVLDVGPTNGTLTLNSDGSFSYTPNANYNGPDSFSYHANDGTADSNAASVTISVNPINDAPVVTVTAPSNGSSFNQDDSITFTGTASDGEDGDLTASLAWSSDLDGSIGNGGSFSTSTLSAGTHTITASVTDSGGLSGSGQITLTVNPGASIIDSVATGETSAAGTVSGDYILTHSDDGNAEAITEQESGGKPSTRYSYLEHKWIFDVSPGNIITLYANAWRTTSSDGDTFTFAYSTNDVTYIDMFSVDSTSDGAPLSYVLPAATQGTVYVRVTDSDHLIGHLTLDTIFVDHLYIRSETQPGNPPAAPSDLSAVAISVSQVKLTWTDNATDEDGFYIQRSEDNSNWTLIDTVGANVTTYTDAAVFPSTTYYYRVRAYNASGPSGYSNTASATTPAGLNLTGTGYKVKGVQTVDLTWSGGSATTFDVYRDGNRIASGVTGNSYTDNIGLKGSGIYQYQVCEAGSSTNCSNIIQISF